MSQGVAESCHKKKSIVLSGHDGFISNLNNQRKTSDSHKEEERKRYGKDEIDFLSTETDLTAHSFKSQGERGIHRSGEYGDRKVTHKGVAVRKIRKEILAPRDSSLIW